MITTTHVVVNALAVKIPTLKKVISKPKAFIFGGLAPDMFLYIASIVMFSYYSLTTNLATDEIFDYIYNDLFFNNIYWLIGQNILHAPFVLIGLYFAAKKFKKYKHVLQSFALGAGLHTVIDVFTHHNDGPLVLFPFNLSYRFSSPISYWDPAHYGNILAPIDLTITVVGGLILVILSTKQRRAKSS